MSSKVPIPTLDHPLIWDMLALAKGPLIGREKSVTNDIQRLLENSLGRDKTRLKVREARDRLTRESYLASAIEQLEQLTEATRDALSSLVVPEPLGSDDHDSKDQEANLKRKREVFEASEFKWKKVDYLRKKCWEDINSERHKNEMAEARLLQQPTVTDHADSVTQSNKNKPPSSVAEDPSAVSCQTEGTTCKGSRLRHRQSGKYSLKGAQLHSDE